MAPLALMDEETQPEPSGSQSDRKSSLSSNSPDILSVNQLIQSVKCDTLLYLVLAGWLCDCILNQSCILKLESRDWVSSFKDMILYLVQVAWLHYCILNQFCIFLPD